MNQISTCVQICPVLLLALVWCNDELNSCRCMSEISENFEVISSAIRFIELVQPKVTADLLFAPFILSRVFLQTPDCCMDDPDIVLMRVVNDRLLDRSTEQIRKSSESDSSLWRLFKVNWTLPSRLSDPRYEVSSREGMNLPSDDYLNEEREDDCYQELLNNADDCIDLEQANSCFDFNTKIETKRPSGYRITHSILYLLLVKYICKNSYKSKIDNHIDALTDIMEDEFEQHLKNRDFLHYTVSKDLVAEIGVVGLLTGDKRFYKPELADYLRRTQDGSGCFMPVEPKGVQRRLLMEELTDDGCSTHLTAVCLSYLIMVFHYDIMQCSINCQMVDRNSMDLILVSTIVFGLIVFLARCKCQLCRVVMRYQKRLS